MSRVSSFVVILRADISEEYFQRMEKALRMFEGVIVVEPYVAGEDIVSEITAQTREKSWWIDKLVALFKDRDRP